MKENKIKSDQKNYAYILLNPNSTHQNTSEASAKVEEIKIKMAYDLHMTVDRQF